MKKLKIKSVKSLGQIPTACLTMESDSHNFLLSSGVVSGNSHAIAYACVSYISMWFKYYYPAEWISAVLTGSDKEDFKSMYLAWNKFIRKPDINSSKDYYFITNADPLHMAKTGIKEQVVMPFSSINGVGIKAVESIIKEQPYVSFEDFFSKIDKRRVNKKTIINLVLSGCFDVFKTDPEMSINKFRKGMIYTFFELRYKDKKPSKADREEDNGFLQEVMGWSRGKLLMKEISLLNFTAFDYHEYYKDKMVEGSIQKFGRAAMKPGDAIKLPNKAPAVVGGAVESIMFFPVKTGKNKGKEMGRMVLSNDGGSIEVTIFPGTLEDDMRSEKPALRNIEEYTPIIVKGNINDWNGKSSLILGECWILI